MKNYLSRKRHYDWFSGGDWNLEIHVLNLVNDQARDQGPKKFL